LTFLVCTAFLVQHRRGIVALARPAKAILHIYVYCFAAAVVMTIRNNRLLEFDYLASILMPMVFLALGVTVLKVPWSVGEFWYFMILTGCCTICIWPLSKPGRYQLALILGLALPYLVGIIGLGARMIWPAHTWAWMFSLGCMAVASFGLVPAAEGRAWKVSYDGLATTRRVAAAIEAIEQRVPEGRVPVFWIDNYTDPMRTDYRSIMCGFMTHRMSMWNFPSVDNGRSYPPGTFLVMITGHKDVFEVANATITRVGMPLLLVGRDQIGTDGGSYWITYTRVLSR
jgi:hypothetical protein